MFQEEISRDYIVTMQGTSEGTQIKYYKDGFWYKKDSRGKEGLTEYLISRLLTFSDLEEKEYILYEQGTVNGLSGCRSRNFLSRDQELITFYRLYYNEFGRDISSVLNQMNEMEERIEYVIRYIQDSCDLDIREYLGKCLMLDMITLNEDRHLNNLALICDRGQFQCAPIFDNGCSLLTASQSVNWNFPVEENVRRVVARPFSGSHEKMYRYFGKTFHIDGKAALKWLEGEPASREKEVLVFQLKKYRKLGIID